MDANFENLQINEFIEDLKKEYLEIKNATVKIAISGQSGSGKSSLINAIVGKKVAEVGIVETTIEIKKYISEGIHFFDLPGCGTEKFPIANYIQQCELESFDAVIIVTANRFYENDIRLIKETIQLGRPVFVVRSKMDETLINGKIDNGLNESEVFNKVILDIKSNIGDLNVKGIYLIASREPYKMDLSNLLKDITQNLDEIKRIRFISDTAPRNIEMLMNKKQVAEKKIQYRSLLSAVNGVNPIIGVDIAVDIAILIDMGKEIQKVFSLDEKNFNELSKKIHNESAKTSIKTRISQFTTKFITKEGVVILLKRMTVSEASKESLKYIPLVGQAIAAGIGYKMTSSLGYELLDDSYKLAKEILEEAEKQIVEK